MNEKLVKEVMKSLDAKPTEELLEMWKANDRGIWSEEAFEAMRRILVARGQLLGHQRELVSDQPAGETGRAKRFSWTKRLALLSAACTLPLFIILPADSLLGPLQLAKPTVLFLDLLTGAIVGLVIDLVRLLPSRLWARRLGLISCSALGVLALLISLLLPSQETVRAVRTVYSLLVNNPSIALWVSETGHLARALATTKNGVLAGLGLGAILGVLIGGLLDLVTRVRGRSEGILE